VEKEARSVTTNAIMVILAHRANLEGPNPKLENSLEATQRALEMGFGIETDLRRDADRQFYISHDLQPRTPENDFGLFSELFQKFSDRVVAMNVKELGYEKDLIGLQTSGAMGRHSFYFDFELLEPATPGRTQKMLRALAGNDNVGMASRLSDRNEPLDQCLSIPAHVVWADEFDSFWLTREHIEAVHAAKRQVYAISPEIHGFKKTEQLQRWREFKEWGIDGLCTDDALEARAFFTK
jgi:glycerophosphoryl diester phosphodiesterase